MTAAVIVDVIRTASGKGKLGGQLSGIHPADMLSRVLRTLVERNDIDPELIDDVIGGCVSQAGQQAFNITRSAVLGAGLPEPIPATTIDRQCGSSQQAAHFAAQGVMSGAYDVVIACGVESMSRVPMGSSMSTGVPFTPQLLARYDGNLVPQGISAELLAADFDLTREQVDDYGYRSHVRAARATTEGLFRRELFPIKVEGGGEGAPEVLDVDEGIRMNPDRERMATLMPPFFSEDMGEKFPEIRWVVTAGNSSQITDGAA